MLCTERRSASTFKKRPVQLREDMASTMAVTALSPLVSDGNETDCDFAKVDGLMKSLQLVIYIPIFVFGLMLNTTALVVFYVLLKKWTETTIYMTNLALMDLLLLFSLPFKMHATTHKWAVNVKLFCSFLESLHFVTMYGSIYTIMCISIDRYISIKLPIQARTLRSPRMARMVCLLIWVLVLSATVPVYKFHNTDEKQFRCFHEFSNDGWNPVLIACVEVFGFLLPALVLVVCSVQIIHTLKKSQECSAKSLACARIIYSSLFAFLVPFTPSHLGIFLQFLVHQGTITDCTAKTQISLYMQVTMCLANITCCLDAVCYYFMTREIRSSKDILTRSISYRRPTSTSEV
ncbi:G-protein coupled receptor 55 [Paramormyrops kingsleyae]|uniref:G-protein coupled receptor 55 n=1 Tax=Paramormyrops kingsleyae TaxID=1676925 RepID=UPI003B972E51